MLVLGAAGLGVERLLLTAVAPRMVAVVGPGEQSDDSPTLLSVLRRASALVIRGGGTGGGRVVLGAVGPPHHGSGRPGGSLSGGAIRPGSVAHLLQQRDRIGP